MFGVLEGVIDGLVVPAELDAIREVLALRDRLDAKIAAALAELDASGGCGATGAVSTAAWLRSAGGCTRAEAHRWVRAARLVREAPVVGAAWADGRLSSGQVEAVAANVGRHGARFAEHADEVVGVVGGLGVDGTARVMQAWRARADALDDGPAPEDRPGRLQVARALDGRGDVRGELNPDVTELLVAALRVATVPDPARPLAERQAEGLGVICDAFLRGGGRRRRGQRPHVNVVVAYESLRGSPRGRYVDGPPVSPGVLRAMLCDADVHRVVAEGGSAILDFGRATRTVPTDLADAVVLRDQGCRWPGCDRPAHWCHAHHLQAWYQGGATSLDNLVSLCARHHHRLHQPGWHAKLRPDGTFELTRPDGTTDRSAPPGLLTARGP